MLFVCYDPQKTKVFSAASDPLFFVFIERYLTCPHAFDHSAFGKLRYRQQKTYMHPDCVGARESRCFLFNPAFPTIPNGGC